MRLCVFCGSNPGHAPAYTSTAHALGTALGQRGLHMVYGGARVGLMGTVADAARAAGASVIGVIPQMLWEREVAHTGLDDLRVVGSMHERKALMADLADGFIALPGGLGTFEELFEIWTWALLGLHRKPIAVLNVDGYYTPLLTFLDQATATGFVRAEHRALLLVERSVDAMLDRILAAQVPAIAPPMDPGLR